MSGDLKKQGNRPGQTAEQSATPASNQGDGAAGDGADGKSGAASELAGVADPSQSSRAWSNLWQIPSIALSAILIALGVYAARGPSPGDTFDGAMEHVDGLIAAGKFEDAAARLRDGIEPNLELALPAQRARFHRTVGDMLFRALSEQHLDDPATMRQVADRYAQATRLGAQMDAFGLERWAEALLAVGDIDSARVRLGELDSLDRAGSDGSRSDADIHGSRNRLFRKLVEYELRQPDLAYESLMQTLSEYREDPRLSADDQLWTIARQAELRLAGNHVAQAIDMIMVELRRLEDESSSSHRIPSFGELYTLLARGYYELGDYARAKVNLERALEQIDSAEPIRGDVLVLQGQIAISYGEMDSAYEKFQLVVRDFVATRSYLPGLLGRAEVEGMLGDHQASQTDYELLRELLPKGGPRRDIDAQRVGQSLCDRHDAALALGKLDRALSYISIAEGFFPADQVPAEVLFRLASTHRQTADDVLTQAGAKPDEASTAVAPPVDAAVRLQANDHYQRAGEYYARHAGAQGATPQAEFDWTTSLWLSADSYDRGGRQDLAIEQFRKYLDNRAVDDPRRPETLFRIARSFQALLKYERAILYYEQVISEHARSSFAAQSYVPLARCYLGIGRRPEAQQQLRQVLAGDRLLKPDARDYRDALVELGRLYYDDKQFLSAVELFSEAVQRYPDDARILETQFLLADSYRANALDMARKIQEQPALGPSELARLNAIKTEQLQAALDRFTVVCEATADGDNQDSTQGDLVRRATLYRADCAFNLEHYEQAVELYDHAARQYSAHHCSMYALVQIVNCYSAMGDADRASAAHHRALVRLRQLPDSAFEASDALMDRTAWERWLENSPPVAARTVAASSG